MLEAMREGWCTVNSLRTTVDVPTVSFHALYLEGFLFKPGFRLQ